jgi:ATP-binding cassette subfamily B protein
MYGGHTIVTAFGHEQRAIATFDTLNAKYYDGAWRAQFVSGIIMPTMMFVGNLGFVFVAVVGGLLVTRQSIAIGDVQAFIQYARQFSMPIMQLSGIANMIQLTIVAAERVFELLDEPEETPDAPDATVIAEPRGAVQFDRVHFRYKEDVPLIEDLSLEVAPGQTIAIVGPTGAGKTTLVNLLMRFYDVDGGSIRVDGIDIRQVKRGALRRTFGMVLQDTWLFSGPSARTSLTGARGPASDAIVEAGQGRAGGSLHPHAAENYDTLINEEASNLSQGQKQLLTIARAFLADPAVLILDEATSSVDTRTEGAHPGVDAPADARAHRLRHRPPPVDDPQRGSDSDDGRGADRRARLASRSAGRQGALRGALREPVRRPRCHCLTGRLPAFARSASARSRIALAEAERRPLRTWLPVFRPAT